MERRYRRVIVIVSDPLVQEGLRLLLQDLRCDVIFVRNHPCLRRLLTTGTGCPQLIIAPTTLENGGTGEDIIDELRAYYNTDIPVILLESEHSFDVIDYSDRRNIHVSDCLHPKQLRKTVMELLNHAIMPSIQ